MLYRLFGGLSFQIVLARLIVLMTAIPVHEFAHAWAAEKMGDSTARYSRRLSLNPLDHIDPIGALMILLIGIGFARPVPIDSRNFRDHKMGTIVTSLAGPFSNILMALVCMIIAKLLRLVFIATQLGFLVGIYQVVSFMVSVNLMLAVFNLLPIPPLDGWHAICPLLPREIYWKIAAYEHQMVWLVLFLVWFGAFNGILGTLSGALYMLLDAITFFI
ncbi:site-2 protease family protein [Oscillospiraceae bacterium LTW-04]|nr:site-2 protease family protein [Oscillospiraceae bacterium MB24-C1]